MSSARRKVHDATTSHETYEEVNADEIDKNKIPRPNLPSQLEVSKSIAGELQNPSSPNLLRPLKMPMKVKEEEKGTFEKFQDFLDELLNPIQYENIKVTSNANGRRVSLFETDKEQKDEERSKSITGYSVEHVLILGWALPSNGSIFSVVQIICLALVFGGLSTALAYGDCEITKSKQYCIKLPSPSTSLLTLITLCAFVVGFFVNNVMQRWWSIRLHLQGLTGSMTNIIMTLSSMMSATILNNTDPNSHERDHLISETTQFLEQVSVYLICAYRMVYNSARKTTGGFPFLVKKQVITKQQEEFVLSLGTNPASVLMIVSYQIQQAARSGLLGSSPDPMDIQALYSSSSSSSRPTSTSPTHTSSTTLFSTQRSNSSSSNNNNNLPSTPTLPVLFQPTHSRSNSFTLPSESLPSHSQSHFQYHQQQQQSQHHHYHHHHSQLDSSLSSTISSTNLLSLTNDLKEARAQAANALLYIDTQLPYPFVQLVCMVVYSFLAQLIYVAASFIKEGKLTGDSSYTTTGYLTLMTYSMVLLGLLKLFKELSNPMGFDSIDFPGDSYTIALANNLTTIRKNALRIVREGFVDQDHEKDSGGGERGGGGGSGGSGGSAPPTGGSHPNPHHTHQQAMGAMVMHFKPLKKSLTKSSFIASPH